jgi:hypothetical protein
MKFETRDLIALVALWLTAFALWLESYGHPVPEWLRTPLSTVVTVVLGFYFVDSVKKAQGIVFQAPPSSSVSQTPAAPAEAAAAAPAGERTAA